MLEGEYVLFKWRRIGIIDRNPVSRMVFVLPLVDPALNFDRPTPPIHVESVGHNSCFPVDVREEGKETTLEEHVVAESESAARIARTANPVARVAEIPIRKWRFGTRRSKNHDHGLLAGHKRVVILVVNSDFGIG
jgi:hypothetical protein